MQGLALASEGVKDKLPQDDVIFERIGFALPHLLKAGDPRVLINGHPVLVDFRIVAEDRYQQLIKFSTGSLIQKILTDISNKGFFLKITTDNSGRLHIGCTPKTTGMGVSCLVSNEEGALEAVLQKINEKL
jgi:hypothetical protein